MQHWINGGIQQLKALSRPKRYGVLAGLWLFAIAVVSIFHTLTAAILSVSIGTGMIWLLQPYASEHPDKGPVALGRSLLDIRWPTGYECSLAVIGLGVIIGAEMVLGTIQATLAPTADVASHNVSITASNSPSLATIGLLFLGVAVIAPALEELIFRNGIQKLLALRTGPLPAIAITSTIFAVLHVPAYGGFGTPLAGLFLPLGIIFTGSVVFGTLYWRTQNIVVAIVSHGLFNGVVLLYAVTNPPLLG